MQIVMSTKSKSDTSRTKAKENYSTREKLALRKFAKRIAERREELGLSQPELERKARFTKTMISQYENGYRVPSYLNLRQLAKALNVSADYLLCLDTVEPEDSEP